MVHDRSRWLQWFVVGALVAATQGELAAHAQSPGSAYVQRCADPTAFVTSLYRVILKREPDAGGLQYWVNSLGSGTAREAEIKGFFDSAEYQGRNRSNGDHVRDLYAALLGREADPGGLNGWSGLLNSGQSRAQVFQGIMGSAESQGLGAACSSSTAGPGTLVSTKVVGKVTVAVFQRTAPAAQANFKDFSVDVTGDYVAIGGGVRGDEAVGHLLTASYPSPDLTKWLVSTKEHLISAPFAITGYAIGLKVAGLTRQALIDNMRVTKTSTPSVAHPSTSIQAPPGFVLIGGGAQVEWNGAGNILTESRPDGYGNQWVASSKDHGVSSPAILSVWQISIRSYLPSVGAVTTTYREQLSTGGPTSHPAASANLGYDNFALTACGAAAHYTPGYGSLLWKIVPSLGVSFTGCDAGSKDHKTPSAATLSTYVMGMQINGS